MKAMLVTAEGCTRMIFIESLQPRLYIPISRTAKMQWYLKDPIPDHIDELSRVYDYHRTEEFGRTRIAIYEEYVG